MVDVETYHSVLVTIGQSMQKQIQLT